MPDLTLMVEEIKAINSDALQLLDKLLLEVTRVRATAKSAREINAAVSQALVRMSIPLQLVPSMGWKTKVVSTVLVNVLALAGEVGPPVYKNLKSDGFLVQLQELVKETKERVEDLEKSFGVSLDGAFKWTSEDVPNRRGGQSGDMKKSFFVRVILAIKEEIVHFCEDHMQDFLGSPPGKTVEEREDFSRRLLLCLQRMRRSYEDCQKRLDEFLAQHESANDGSKDPDEPSGASKGDEHVERPKVTAYATDNDVHVAITACAAKLIYKCLQEVPEERDEVTRNLQRGKKHELVLANLCARREWPVLKLEIVSSGDRVTVKGVVEIGEVP